MKFSCLSMTSNPLRRFGLRPSGQDLLHRPLHPPRPPHHPRRPKSPRHVPSDVSANISNPVGMPWLMNLPCLLFASLRDLS